MLLASLVDDPVSEYTSDMVEDPINELQALLRFARRGCYVKRSFKFCALVDEMNEYCEMSF